MGERGFPGLRPGNSFPSQDPEFHMCRPPGAGRRSCCSSETGLKHAERSLCGAPRSTTRKEGQMTSIRARKRITSAFGAAALIASLAGIAYAHSGAWGPPQKIDEINGNSSELNTTFLDGCPIQSPDGLSLYMASNRPRYVGDTRTDLDIWVAHRRNKHAPFGAPQNVASPVNTTADDFCQRRSATRGFSSRAGESCLAPAEGRTSTSRASIAEAAGATRSTLPARSTEARTAPPTSKAPHTCGSTMRRFSTSRAARTST
jgi:hypothetical protein